jgi:hypothetical protein
MSAYMIWGLVLLAVVVAGLVLHFRYPVGSPGRRNLRWSIWGVIALFVGLFLDYTLPQHDIVRITDTYNRLTTVGWENSIFYSSPDTGTAESTTTRDIRFINGVFPDESVIVYRNEDTGWWQARTRPFPAPVLLHAPRRWAPIRPLSGDRGQPDRHPRRAGGGHDRLALCRRQPSWPGHSRKSPRMPVRIAGFCSFAEFLPDCARSEIRQATGMMPNEPAFRTKPPARAGCIMSAG